MVRLELRCHKHPRYDPRKGGTSAIKGGCDQCFELCRIVGELDRIGRLPTGSFWKGLGNITVPLVLAFKGARRRSEPAPNSDKQTLELFEREVA